VVVEARAAVRALLVEGDRVYWAEPVGDAWSIRTASLR